MTPFHGNLETIGVPGFFAVLPITPPVPEMAAEFFIDPFKELHRRSHLFVFNHSLVTTHDPGAPRALSLVDWGNAALHPMLDLAPAFLTVFNDQ